MKPIHSAASFNTEVGFVEELARRKASDLVLKVCFLPFMAVAGITVTFYDVTRLDDHSDAIFLSVVAFLHTALFVFWKVGIKAILKSSRAFSFSTGIVRIGLALAYDMGLFIGWILHKNG